VTDCDFVRQRYGIAARGEWVRQHPDGVAEKSYT